MQKHINKLIRTNFKAISLTEILIAISIITIFTLILVPTVAGQVEKARRAAALQDIESGLAAALDRYEADNGRYPTSQQGLDALLEPPEEKPQALNWQGPYLQKNNLNDPWGNPYQYRYPGEQNKYTYDLYSFGADGSAGGEDIDRDIVNWE